MVKDFVETRFLSGSCCKRYVNVRACSTKKQAFGYVQLQKYNMNMGLSMTLWLIRIFFLKSPFPLSKTRKTALETHHVIPCSLFLTQNHPVESTEASLYDPVLGCEYPSLRSSYKAEEKDGSFMEMEICRLWISDDIRWYGYRWMESVVKGESLLWIFISRFSILWICWWRDFSRSWMWFRSVAPCRIVISISGALHFLFSYLFIPSIWILYINRMNRPRSRVRTWIFRCPRSSGSEFSRMARDCGWMEERFVDQADSILQPGWHVCFLH